MAGPGPIEPQEKALVWKCRRGMRELDVLLTRYLESDYPGANADDKAGFKALLELQDPEIFAYLTGRELPGDARIQRAIACVRGDAQV